MWIVANAIGMLGYLLSLVFSSAYRAWGLDVTLIIGSAIIGTSLGIAQWFVLRWYGYHSIWWILSSTLGWAMGTTISRLLDPVIGVGFTSLIGDASIAIITGVLQTFAIRRWSSHAGWWILVYLIGRIASSGFELFIGPPAGIIFGTITGLPLIWMLRHPIQQPAQSTPSSGSSV
jgi:hypothetical protein